MSESSSTQQIDQNTVSNLHISSSIINSESSRESNFNLNNSTSNNSNKTNVFKVISTANGRITTALNVHLSPTNSAPAQINRNAIKLDLTNKRHPRYTPEVSLFPRRVSQAGLSGNGTSISTTLISLVDSSGRVSPGLLADPGEELLIQNIIQNHKKYSRDYLISLRESKRALQLPVGLPNIPDLLPTSKQVIIVQTNSNAGPHKANHHKQAHHNSNNNNHYNNNRRATVGDIQNQGSGVYQPNGQHNHNYNKYYNNQHHNNHFNQNYGKK